MNTLPDYLKNNLDIILVGLNPSPSPSSRTGPTPVNTQAGIHPLLLSSRMRGPIPSVIPANNMPF